MRELTEINVLAELDRYTIKYEWSGSDDVKICCPFHADNHPSCDVSVSKRVFKCKGAACPKPKGDFVTLLAGFTHTSRAVILEELGKRYNLADTKIVEPETVERWHEAIWKAGPLLAELYKRAVTDDDIRLHKLGEDGGRITIPIKNEHGDYVNVRKYLPGAPGNEKMKNQRGRGSARLFPIEQLKYSAIMLCGGEMKAIAAGRQLNPRGIGAICATMAEDLLPPAMLQKFAGKTVYVCEDIDAHGRAASQKNCIGLKPLVAEVHDILLPLDIVKHPKGDINDYVAGGGDLWDVIQKSEPWTPAKQLSLTDDAPQKVHLNDSVNAKYAAKRVAVTGTIAAMDAAPYVIPREITVTCDKSQNFCSACPVWSSLDAKFEIHPEHSAILSVVAASKRTIPEALMEAVGIPRVCRVCEFKAESYYNAEDVRLSPQLEITERAADSRMQPAICIGNGLELNESYEFTGRMYPHPATQCSVLLISKYDATRDALSTYSPPDSELELLRLFQPSEWTVAGVDGKLSDIYTDFEQNVTRIRQRRDMHAVIDLIYHSPLLFIMDNRVVKGWTEGLIIGDSGHGKTEAGTAMMRHYGLGERMECKNATVAGTLGGLQQLGNGRWFATWGSIPRNDRRLLLMEELKGTHTDVISKWTDMRSSGIAEMVKIGGSRRTHARTRLLITSNARLDRKIASYGFGGIEATKELIGALEDVRRFDIVHCVADGEVSADVINVLVEDREPKYNSVLCRALVLWAWTRGPDQCLISSETALTAMRHATTLCEEFTDAIPLIDKGTMRNKLMRLANAVACRTFSCSPDMQSIETLPCHVDWVADFLRRTYSTKAMGYLEYTEATRIVGTITDTAKIKERFAAMPFPHEVVEAFLRADRFDTQDIMDWTDFDIIEAKRLLGLLVRKFAVRRDAKGYRKTPSFIALLQGIKLDKGLVGKPNWIPEAEF